MLARFFFFIAIAIGGSFLTLYLYNQPVDYQQVRHSAEQGDHNSQYQLGLMLLEGREVEANPIKAQKWFRLAAEQGHPQAQYQVALYFQRDYAATQDVEQGKVALEWLKKAADNGCDAAKTDLGRSYVEGEFGEGIFIKIDLQVAENLFRQAVEKDNNDARYELARLLEINPEFVRSDDNLEDLYQASAEAGNPDAQYHLGRLYYTGRWGNKNQAKALEWMRKSALQGNAKAEFVMGTVLERSGQVQDAIVYYRNSAEQDFAQAHTALGSLYLTGEHVDKDIGLAEIHLRNAARLGDQNAENKLVKLMAEQGDAKSQFYYGEILSKTERHNIMSRRQVATEKSLVWYEKSALQGYAPAQHELGSRYSFKDPKKAYSWYLKAAEQGYSPAQWNLSFLYARGKGVEKNLIKAKMWQIVSDQQNPKIMVKRTIHTPGLPALTEQQIQQAERLAQKCIKREYRGCS